MPQSTIFMHHPNRHYSADVKKKGKWCKSSRKYLFRTDLDLGRLQMVFVLHNNFIGFTIHCWKGKFLKVAVDPFLQILAHDTLSLPIRRFPSTFPFIIYFVRVYILYPSSYDQNIIIFCVLLKFSRSTFFVNSQLIILLKSTPSRYTKLSKSFVSSKASNSFIIFILKIHMLHSLKSTDQILNF